MKWQIIKSRGELIGTLWVPRTAPRNLADDPAFSKDFNSTLPLQDSPGTVGLKVEDSARPSITDDIRAARAALDEPGAVDYETFRRELGLDEV